MGQCAGAILKPNQSCPSLLWSSFCCCLLRNGDNTSSAGTCGGSTSSGSTTTSRGAASSRSATGNSDARACWAGVQALVPVPQPQGEAEPIFSPPIPLLPVQLGVSIPVCEFRVRQLLALAPGQVIETRWSTGDDLPLAAGEVQLAWSEFEVVETRLAVRVTRLA